MARKRRKKDRAVGNKPLSDGRKRAGTSLGASLLGGLAWLVGGFTLENAIEWAKHLLVAVVLVLFVRWLFIEPFKIPSGSMRPTLVDGDRIFVNKLLYGVRAPFMNKRLWRGAELERGDMVVFRAVEKSAQHRTLVKRVVGLPGERIHIAGGDVFVNGRRLTEPSVIADNEYTSIPRGLTDMRYGILKDDAYSLVPPNHYLLLGDNSPQSRDGRTFGWVPNDNILGRVSCVWRPVTRWRDFTGFSKTWQWRSLVVLLGLLLVCRIFLGRSWRIGKDGACDTLAEGDHILVNHCSFGLSVLSARFCLCRGRAPRRGEFVLYRPPSNGDDVWVVLLGRVAGLPGEQVCLEDGCLLINGAPVARPSSLSNRAFRSGAESGRFGRSKSREYSVVPTDHYFIVSDDDQPGSDSRTLGWVAHRHLMGSVSVVWWPPKRWRRVNP